MLLSLRREPRWITPHGIHFS